LQINELILVETFLIPAAPEAGVHQDGPELQGRHPPIASLQPETGNEGGKDLNFADESTLTGWASLRDFANFWFAQEERCSANVASISERKLIEKRNVSFCFHLLYFTNNMLLP
jgi:hypothetical protein